MLGIDNFTEKLIKKTELSLIVSLTYKNNKMKFQNFPIKKLLFFLILLVDKN